MKYHLYVISIVVTCLLTKFSIAQELFVFTEPASNMPAKSLSLRLQNVVSNNTLTHEDVWSVEPEIMFGFTKKLMAHISTNIVYAPKSFKSNNITFYAKWRLFSKDTVHRHFRIALATLVSYNAAGMQQKMVMLNGMQPAYQVNTIFTQLLHKTALSLNIGYAKQFYTKHFDLANGALTYSFSAGKLFFPTVYKNYRQLNINGMVELLGQLQQKGVNWLGITPSLQFICKSNLQINLGYVATVNNSLQAIQTNGALVKIEYTFYNALARKKR